MKHRAKRRKPSLATLDSKLLFVIRIQGLVTSIVILMVTPIFFVIDSSDFDLPNLFSEKMICIPRLERSYTF